MSFDETSSGRDAWLCFGQLENCSSMDHFFFNIKEISSGSHIILENAFLRPIFTFMPYCGMV